MVRYCTNGYRLWSPEDRKILFERDLVFDETRFQFEGHSDEEWISIEDSNNKKMITHKMKKNNRQEPKQEEEEDEPGNNGTKKHKQKTEESPDEFRF